MKSLYIIALILTNIQVVLAQVQSISGRVTTVDGIVLVGVNIQSLPSNQMAITDKNGSFTINLKNDTSIRVSSLGYEGIIVPLEGTTSPLSIVLNQTLASVEEVIVTTGYQSLPKERATGSFATLDNALINRSVSTDILSRMENVTSGLLFDKRFPNEAPGLRIRGESTIRSDASPLIIVDNFPYEGRIENINPNDVENITVLKDASAASIWGARAGNGVIVITTKQGKLNRPLSVDINSNLTMGTRPDLFFNRSFLSSSDFIEVERYLFNKGYYEQMEANIRYPVLSPAVELLIAQRDNNISTGELETEINKLKSVDIRHDLNKYFYRAPVSQQYSLNLSGGEDKSTYYLGTGFVGCSRPFRTCL